MKLCLRQKTVLDEREMQEMYRIEHRGLWAMYTLLCAAVVVQLFFGAGFAQIAGEVCVISLVSVAMIVAYARRGIWDTRARPSTKGNAAYSALCALGVSVVVLGIRGDVAAAVVTGICTFVLCFSLLCALMAYMQRRQKHEADELDD
ncbi:MAG TPA: hypothetical protein IAC19_11160 [Candidatus Ventricola gallistercoris]|nr:hypothetical protein [Candidatus Ventricola gallistercoris]